jgi:hypothetical protein
LTLKQIRTHLSQAFPREGQGNGERRFNAKADGNRR